MQKNPLTPISTAMLAIGLLIFLVLGGIPAIYTFVMSTRDFSPVHGIFGSPAVGLDNFRELFRSFAFSRHLINSAILSLVPSVLAVAIAIPAAGAVGTMKAGRQRSVSTIALLLPAFIPDVILTFIAFRIFSGTLTLATPSSYRVVIILLSAIRPASVCAFVGACTASIFKDKGKSVMHGAAAGVFIGISASLVRFLTGNIELQWLLLNPLVFLTGDTLGTAGFRLGMQHFNMSSSSAMWVVRVLPQMLMAVPVALAASYCVRLGLGCRHEDVGSYNSEHGMHAGPVPGFVGVLVFVAGLFLPIVVRHSSAPAAQLMQYLPVARAIGNSVIMTVFTVILFGALLFTLAAWLSVNISKAGALILVLVLVAMVNSIDGEFIFLRNLGLTDTYLAVILSGAFNIAFVLPLAFLARLKSPGADSIAKPVQAMLPYIVAFAGLFAANTLGGLMPQTLYLFSTRLWGISVLFRSAGLMFGYMPTIGLILAFALPLLALAAVTVLLFVMTDMQKATEINFAAEALCPNAKARGCEEQSDEAIQHKL